MIDHDREMDKADRRAPGYVRTTAKKEREKTRIEEMARAMANESAFDKSEEIFPMAGDCPPEVFADKEFRAIFHLWKRAGGKQDDPRVQRMRERWMAIVGGGT